MFVEGLALYLAKMGVGKVGSTIFADAMPQDAKSAVMVTSWSQIGRASCRERV